MIPRLNRGSIYHSPLTLSSGIHCQTRRLVSGTLRVQGCDASFGLHYP